MNLNTEEAKIDKRRNDLKGYRGMVKEIVKCKEAYGYKVIQYYHKKSQTSIEMMKAATSHMDDCVVGVSQRVLDLVPKLEKYIKTDRHGLARVYHIRWALVEGEIVMAIMKADIQ